MENEGLHVEFKTVEELVDYDRTPEREIKTYFDPWDIIVTLGKRILAVEKELRDLKTDLQTPRMMVKPSGNLVPPDWNS